MAESFELVRVRSGAWGIRSRAYGEVCHPGVGPAAEAAALYRLGLRLTERMRAATGGFVVWDIGLGGGANALAALDAARAAGGTLTLVSFDRSLDFLAFARRHAAELGYLAGREAVIDQLLDQPVVAFRDGDATVTWRRVLGDFPGLLRGGAARDWPAPDAVLWDPHSPAANPEMWTLPLFREVVRCLNPARPCSLATYSRSTSVRVALLLAGLFVGAGGTTSAKEDSTVAANDRGLVDAPLDSRWLARAQRSGAAEPWDQPPYEARPLRPETWHQLRRHPQFAALANPPAA